jgi:hypothetical protein
LIALQPRGRFATLGKVAEQYPRLKLIIDHLGQDGAHARGKGGAGFANVPELLALAPYPNVAIKASPSIRARRTHIETSTIPTRLDLVADVVPRNRRKSRKLGWGNPHTAAGGISSEPSC